MRGLGRTFKRGDTFWISYYHRGREYRESTHSTSEAVAVRALKTKWKELGRGKHPGTSEDHVTVAELLNDTETDFTIRRLASLPALQSQMPPLLEACREELCERAVDVTTARVRRIMARWQRDGVADATINRRIAYLRRAFRLAREAEPAKVTTAPVFPRLPEHNARQGFFDKPTFQHVLTALPADGLRDFVEWAFWTGMRKGEIASLTWDAFDRETWTMRLHAKDTKNHRPRRLVLVRELRAIIERRLEARCLDCRLIFHRAGAPVREFRRSWATACNAAGVSGRLFHDLRRTGVRNLIRSGVERATAMKISGHRTESVFERYNIGDDDDLRAAMERVSAYVDRLPSESTVISLGAVRELSENGVLPSPTGSKTEVANS